MSNLFSENSIEVDKEFPKIPLESNETLDQSINEEDTLKEDFEKNFHEIFTNLNYPSCPEKLEKINLENLLNNSIKMDSNDTRNEIDLECNFNIITTHSFNIYSVSSSLNKIKFLKNLKEENSKIESTYQVNTHSSENVQKSDILITEDLDSLINNVKSMPIVPKLQQMAPIINMQQIKRDDNSVNKKKKKNKRKRIKDRDRYYKEYMEDYGDRSPKSRKLMSPITKNWDDITIEESQYFDIEDKENSFEVLLSQYNSMKQLPKDIIVISQILNEPTNYSSESSTTLEKKLSLPSPSSSSVASEFQNTTKSLNELTPSSMNTKFNNNTSIIDNDNDDDSTLKFRGDNKDIWNKNSPISSTSSNASVSNMSDEETNYSQSIHLKKHKLDSLKYNSILTPPTPPQPLEEN